MLIRDAATEDCQKPDQSAKQAGEIGGAFCRKAQRFMQITCQRSERGVVREALKKFADVGDPEGALETYAHVLEALAKAHESSWRGSSDLPKGCGGMIAEEGRRVTNSSLGRLGAIPRYFA